MRVSRYKLVLTTLVLISIILFTNMYTRSVGYSHRGLFPFVGKSSSPGRSLTFNRTISNVTYSKKINSIHLSGPATDANITYLKANNSPDNRWSHNSSAVNMVAILAYMHTGSSYTGSLFKFHPGTYYFYEPLRSLQNATRASAYITYLNGSQRQLSGTWIDEDLATETVHNLLHCKHEQLDFDTLTRGFYTRNHDRGRDQIPYYRCIMRSKHPDANIIKRCLHLLTDLCLKSNVRAFKFIRLPMRPVQELLRRNENLRIIYLVRDPRAMLDSQVRKNEMGTRNLVNFTRNTERLCQKMHEDFKIYNNFPQSIRDRIKLVRYEDLTDKPQEVTSRMFQFTEVAMLDSDRDYVKETTRKGDDSTRYKIDKWRKHLTQVRLDILNKHCRQVYEHFGYVPYSDIRDIGNFKKPSYTYNPVV